MWQPTWTWWPHYWTDDGEWRLPTTVDPKEVNAPKSPWKTPVVDGNGKDVAVMMGTESWPALADAQRQKNLETAAKVEDAAVSVPVSREVASRPPPVQVRGLASVSNGSSIRAGMKRSSCGVSNGGIFPYPRIWGLGWGLYSSL
ncbi:la-related protein 1A-like [Senna tora]|uniref:La-related protein 1A-like n=1 Tax=Senna tora TaxID=362788 RepID=A0A834U0D1_9FABA|nr:la-related protein 1A-like [Senna tora]